MCEGCIDRDLEAEEMRERIRALERDKMRMLLDAMNKDGKIMRLKAKRGREVKELTELRRKTELLEKELHAAEEREMK